MKKVLSLILSGALALGMLTACGGSSGSSTANGPISYDNSRIAAATKQFSGGDAKIAIKTGTGDEAVEMTISTHNGKTIRKAYYEAYDYETVLETGDKFYMIEYKYNSRPDYDFTASDGFAVELSDKSVENVIYDEMEEIYTTDVWAPTKDTTMSVTAGKMSFEGKEYYSETVKNYVAFAEGKIALEETFYFDGQTPKYVLIEGEVYEITAYTSSIDASQFELPSKILAEDDFFASRQNG